MSETIYPSCAVKAMTSADTEYTIALPPGTVYFTVKSRDGTAFRLAFATGKVAGSVEPYFTIGSGGSYTSPEKMDWSGTLYVACASPSKTVEVIFWTKTPVS
ncbi:MAG TPA: hypothetical protein VGE52_04250 [Pirellulales bacterium]